MRAVPSAHEAAAAQNQRLITAIQRRADAADGVLGPCLRAYQARVEKYADPHELLHDLTAPLLAGWEETLALIRARMELRWAGNPEQIQRSIVNSLRRSAGTNYQGLVSYALARYLIAAESAWSVQHPVPGDFKRAVAIVFGSATTLAPQDDHVDEGEFADAGLLEPTPAGQDEEIVVQPDVDILLRNQGWIGQGPEPVVLLSLKTSLVDRAGMAARWKIYFDLATRPCPHIGLDGCAYHHLGIRMDNADRYSILHGIVTANIYKIQFHDERYRVGELGSAQTRSNTYMFDLKLTTRDDGIAITPESWRQLPALGPVLRELSSQAGIPE